MSKTGLVLSGGGAKGAYQVGVMKALLELNIPIDMLAGASIGALNGGILASAPDLHVGTERLEQVWERLSEINPIQMRSLNEWLLPLIKKVSPYATYLTLLTSAGLVTKISSGLIGYLWQQINNGQFPETEFKSVCQDQVLHDMMNEFLDITQLQKSIPLYVSVYKNDNPLKLLIDIGKAELLGLNNKESIFKHIQSLPITQQKEMLLASAAIPILFETRYDENKRAFTDGGQGGWLKSQGNTPITPLIEAGCDFVIITHLSHDVMWHRHDFPNTTCIEIRPNTKLDLSLTAMFDFSSEKINSLKNIGYEDTMNHIGTISEILEQLSAKRKINQQLDQIVNKRSQSENTLNEAMLRLK